MTTYTYMKSTYTTTTMHRLNANKSFANYRIQTKSNLFHKMEYAELKTVTDPNILSFNLEENINCEITQQITVANGNSVMNYSSNFNKTSQHLPVTRSESALSISTPFSPAYSFDGSQCQKSNFKLDFISL